MSTTAALGLVVTGILGMLVNPCPARSAGDAEVGVVVEGVEKLIAAGHFTNAERILRAEGVVPGDPVIGPPAVALEIIRRIRLDYALTPERMLAKLRHSIADVTAADMERWREQGLLQFRRIDDKTWYFEREPSNLLRFCPEARSRRRPRILPAGGKFSKPAHVARLVRLARSSSVPEVLPVRHRVTYRLTVNRDHPRLRPGAEVRCWLPFPQQYRQQQQVRLIRTDPDHAAIAPNGHPHRTIYFEQTLDDGAKPPEFLAEFEFVTCAYCPDLDPSEVAPYDRQSALYRQYTAARPPHIVFTPRVRRVVEQIGSESNPLLRARKIFRWLCTNVRYCAETEYSTIPNISDKGLTARRGDCGVQALAFIALCRAAGIPARWQSGWQTLPNNRNMHDWAEFYVEPWGWLPADPSYGIQKHPDPRVQEFYCGHLDPYRMIVNLDYGRQLQPSKTSFRSEPNDFQRGEIEVDGHNLYFDEWDWTFQAQTLPLERGFGFLEEALDAVVPDALAEGRVPGAVVAVGRKTAAGYQTWQKAYGFCRIKPQTAPMTEDAIFDLASVTKPIATGMSLMILAEQGKLDLDAAVGQFLPEFSDGDKKDVTVRHLMVHRSGARPYVGAEAQRRIQQEAGFPCPQRTRAFIRSLELAGTCGDTVVYSCLNAILGAEIVRAVSGMELDRFAAQHIFKPLRMTDTQFNPPPALRARCVPSTQAGHGAGADGFLTGQVHDPLAAMQGGVSGNAGLFSTVADLARVAQMLLGGGELDGVRVLREQTVREMTRVQYPDARNTKGLPARRGLLWDTYVADPGNAGAGTVFAFGHNGYTGTALRIYPEQGVYVVLLTNRVHPDDSGKVGPLREVVWKTVGALLMADAVRTTSVRPAGGR